MGRGGRALCLLGAAAVVLLLLGLTDAAGEPSTYFIFNPSNKFFFHKYNF